MESQANLKETEANAGVARRWAWAVRVALIVAVSPWCALAYMDLGMPAMLIIAAPYAIAFCLLSWSRSRRRGLELAVGAGLVGFLPVIFCLIVALSPPGEFDLRGLFAIIAFVAGAPHVTLTVMAVRTGLRIRQGAIQDRSFIIGATQAIALCAAILGLVYCIWWAKL